jgi:hypothetical protein
MTSPRGHDRPSCCDERMASGRDGWIDHVNNFATALPDAAVTVGRIVAAAHNVAGRWSATGPPLRCFLGVAVTGRRSRATRSASSCCGIAVADTGVRLAGEARSPRSVRRVHDEIAAELSGSTKPVQQHLETSSTRPSCTSPRTRRSGVLHAFEPRCVNATTNTRSEATSTSAEAPGGDHRCSRSPTARRIGDRERPLRSGPL